MKTRTLKMIRKYWDYRFHDGKLITCRKADGEVVTHTGIILCDGRELHVNPDVVADFTNMPWDSNSFKMVFFDPPHLNRLGKNSWMAKKYGVLTPTWETDLRAGFDECMRVLEPYGVLIFKWNESQIKLNDVLKLIPYQPLTTQRMGKENRTIWIPFMKMPA